MNSQLFIGLLLGLVVGQYLWPLIVSLFYRIIGTLNGTKAA